MLAAVTDHYHPLTRLPAGAIAMKTFYALCCIPGFLLPWSLFIPWLRERHREQAAETPLT